MGRPKGSVNRKKSNASETPNKPPITDAPTTTPTLEEGAQVADGGAEGEAEKVEAEPQVERDFDQVAHDMAEVQGQLDDLEAEKAAVMKDYGKRIGVLASKVSQLASEYRHLERREVFDYTEGVCRIYCGHTGALLETRPIADQERQLSLDDLPKPAKPPAAIEVGQVYYWPGSGLRGTITEIADGMFSVEYAATEDIDGNEVVNEPARLTIADFLDADPVCTENTDS